ncbi:hypothetical protein AB0G54_31835 [Streptomyces yokosukanensis]
MGWFTAYRGDWAVVATVAKSSHRPETAEAVVRTVLASTTG